MNKANQAELIRRIFRHLDDSTTTMAPASRRQKVSAYTSATVSEEEKNTLFLTRPIVVGLSGDLQEAGDYLTTTIADTPVVVIRQVDGSLGGFVNACRHRGSPLLEGRGRLRSGITCPFHGWGYRQDGRLAAIPGQAGFDDQDRDCLSLLPLEVTEEFGVVMVRLRKGSEKEENSPLAALRPDFEPLMIGNFHPHRTEYRTVPMNWKLVVDTFLETYHFPVLHKNSVDSIFIPNCGPFDAFGDHLRLIGVRRSIETLRDQPENSWSLLPHATIVYLIFPATFLIMQTGHIELWQFRPGDDDGRNPVHDTNFSVSLYAPKPIETDAEVRHWDANLELLLSVTMNEDFANGARIQRGFKSGQQEHLLFGRNEPALIHFHERLDAALEADTLA